MTLRDIRSSLESPEHWETVRVIFISDNSLISVRKPLSLVIAFTSRASTESSLELCFASNSCNIWEHFWKLFLKTNIPFVTRFHSSLWLNKCRDRSPKVIDAILSPTISPNIFKCVADYRPSWLKTVATLYGSPLWQLIAFPVSIEFNPIYQSISFITRY